MSIPTDEEDAGMNGTRREGAHERASRLAVSSEAAEWFVRLRDDRLGARHRERNVRWLKQSPAHIAELLRIQQVYRVLRAAKVQNRPPGAPGESSSNVVELAPRPPPSTEPTESRTRFESWKVAAAVACLMVSLLLGFMVKVAWLDRTLRTELGEWRTAELTDGTQVRIGPDSVLRVAFGDDHRTIRLIRGEAMFSVAKDPSRPFVVRSKMIDVLAVGTEFRVSHWRGEDIVAVTEGSVAVYRDGRDGREALRGAVPIAPAQIAAATGGMALTAGEQVSVTRATRSAPVAKQKVNVDYELAWADGWLVFEDKTIAEVAREFNRRNRTKILVTEPSIAARRLAFFRGSATDPESFVAALAASSDIVVMRDEPDELRIELSPQVQRLEGMPLLEDHVDDPAPLDTGGEMPPTVNPNPV